MTKQTGKAQVDFDPYNGTLVVILPNCQRYVYESDWISDSGSVPSFIARWQAAVKAHPSNVYRVVLKSLNKLIQNPESGWQLVSKPNVPNSSQNLAHKLHQGKLF